MALTKKDKIKEKKFQIAKKKSIKYLRSGMDSWIETDELRFAADFEDGLVLAKDAKNYTELKHAFTVAKELRYFNKHIKK